MKLKSILVVCAFISFGLSSCDWAKDKTKETLHKGGEIVGKAGSEVADGIANGVEETFANLVESSPRITASGVKFGRVKVDGTDSTTDNVVSVYLIFDKHFNGKITAKAIGEDGLEFGRAVMDVVADSGQAKFVDFEFDKRTNIDKGDKVRLE
jgi:hypothetical protein